MLIRNKFVGSFITVNRRFFLKAVGLGSLCATAVVALAGFIRFLYPRVLFEPPSTVEIGVIDDFKKNDAGDIRLFEDWKAFHSIWIVRKGDHIYALLARCTHLGCTPNWFPEEEVFKCPCHGSRFRKDGTNFAGPAPRPMDRLKIYAGRDGKVVVDKRRVFTYKEFQRKGAYLEI